MVEVAASVPRYAQIASRLRGQIAAGEYPPGARIPSEHELATRFQVGRPTVRQATEVLVRERVLDRRRGSGTYVNQAPRDVDLFSVAGTLASFEKTGLPLETRIVARARRRAIPEGATHPLAGRTAYFVARRTAAKRRPVLLEEMYFEASVFPGFDRILLAGRSLSQLAREHYLLRPEVAEQRFRLIAIDARRARYLGLVPGDAILKVERTIDFHGAPRAFFAELYCRTDELAFTQTMSFAQDGLRSA